MSDTGTTVNRGWTEVDRIGMTERRNHRTVIPWEKERHAASKIGVVRMKTTVKDNNVVFTLAETEMEDEELKVCSQVSVFTIKYTQELGVGRE